MKLKTFHRESIQMAYIGGADIRHQLWRVENAMDREHWMAPTLKDCSHDTHLYLLSGGPIDATDSIPIGGMIRTNRYRRSTMTPREIQTD